LPFAGVKIADFSWIGVGPITAVLRRPRGDGRARRTVNPRTGCVWSAVQGQRGRGEPRQFFASFNTSKLSLALNLKQPEGLEVAKRLVRWADVCLDSFTAGTIAELGLGYEVLREINPSIIMASTCLLGQTGPAAALAGYGYHAAAICGFYEITGWDDRPPAGPFNAYTDTIAPRFLAATLMAALDHRRRTGQGQYVDQAQMESALYFLAPEILDYQAAYAAAAKNALHRRPTTPTRAPAPTVVHDRGRKRRAVRALRDVRSNGRLPRADVGGRRTRRLIDRARRVHAPPRAAPLMDSCKRRCRPAWCSGRAMQEDRSSGTGLLSPDGSSGDGRGTLRRHQFRISATTAARAPAPMPRRASIMVLRNPRLRRRGSYADRRDSALA
jgi:hypothetical protein